MYKVIDNQDIQIDIINLVKNVLKGKYVYDYFFYVFWVKISLDEMMMLIDVFGFIKRINSCIFCYFYV